MGAFLGPFCKDCRHFAADDSYRAFDAAWKENLHQINFGNCSAPIPGLVTGDDSPEASAPQTVYMMRWAGPCGLRGYLFEPRPQAGKGD